MSSLYEKLKHFNEVILNDAALERDRILKSIQSETGKRVEAEKRKLKEQADLFLRKEISLAEAEKNNTISKAVMESKQLLMKTREEIIGKVYADVLGKLKDFTAGSEYLPYLCGQVLESCMTAGEGELVVYLVGRDLEKVPLIVAELKDKLPAGVTFEALEDDLIGGCKVFNKTGSVMVDNTLMQKLELNRDSFFEVCDLRVE